MSWPASIRPWFRLHPTWADAGLAVASLVLAALPMSFGVAAGRLGPDQVFPWMVPAAAALVFRRRFPWWVWVVTTPLGCIGAAVGDGPTPAFFPAVVALYTVSCRTSTARALAATAASAVAPVVLIAASGLSDPFDMLAYGMSLWSGLAGISGIAVRAQRAVVESAQERARQAESSREEEAQRRVVEERVRIARELHDVVAHHVAVINVQAGVAGHLLRTDPDGADQAIAHVREASQTVLREVPDLLGLLRADGEPLETAAAPRLEQLPDLVARARRSGLDVVVRTSGSPLVLTPGVDLAAYRVLQEALTNAGRHGRGGVDVSVDYEAAGLALEVRNVRADATAPVATDRHGLLGIRERVASVGGTVTVGPGPSGTWVVSARLPLRPEARS